MSTEPLNSGDERVSIARLEVQVDSMNSKIDSVLNLLREEQERNETVIADHEARLRAIEKAGDIPLQLTQQENRLDAVERWTHAIPVSLVITLIIAIGSAVASFVGVPTV